MTTLQMLFVGVLARCAGRTDRSSVAGDQAPTTAIRASVGPAERPPVLFGTLVSIR